VRKRSENVETSNISNIQELIIGLEQLRSELCKAIETAERIVEKAERIGGEVSRVVAGQLKLYTIGNLEAFAFDVNQPGSVESLLSFLEEEVEDKK